MTAGDVTRIALSVESGEDRESFLFEMRIEGEGFPEVGLTHRHKRDGVDETQ